MQNIIFLEKMADGLQHWQPQPWGEAEQAEWDAWAKEFFADCTDKERKVMMDTLLALNQNCIAQTAIEHIWMWYFLESTSTIPIARMTLSQ